MNRFLIPSIVSVVFLTAGVLSAEAQQPSPWGEAFKSVAQTAGQAAGQAALQKLSPELQKLVTQSQQLGAPAKQENFLVTKAKEFLLAGNYQPALDLAGYVISALNSKSVDAKKIMADAQAALTKMAQDKLAQTQQASQATQVQSDATKAAEGVKGLFGAFGGK